MAVSTIYSVCGSIFLFKNDEGIKKREKGYFFDERFFGNHEGAKER